MRLLEQRILKDGRALDERILLVDSFLNHQVDPQLMMDIGREFKRLFEREGVTRIATVESSGIAPAMATALAMELPMVIMKKYPVRRDVDGLLETEVFSFTKNHPYILTVKSVYIKPGDRVLLIDDFMAMGEAAFGGIRLIEGAGAKVAGIGAVICKSFQPGFRALVEKGYRVEALAKVSKMARDSIEFEENQ